MSSERPNDAGRDGARRGAHETLGGVAEILTAARAAYARRDWVAARSGFRAASELGDLDADDSAVLADCAWWLGDVDEALAGYERSYRLYLDGDRLRGAALSAVGLAVSLFLRGDADLGAGWMNRARRLLRDEPEGPEHGYLLYLDLEGALSEGDLETVVQRARAIAELGSRFRDPNLVAIGVLFEGRSLVRLERITEGLALLDEAMVAVLSDALAPEWAGNIYCHLMSAFHELADVRRAGEWVDATSRWLESLPAAALFTGICRVHRSQVLQLRGSWAQAEREAVKVVEDLARLHVAGAAEGHYQIGEIRRARGDLTGAAAAYRRAHELGRDPQPGLALVHLAEGRLESGAASIRAALAAEPHDRLARFRLQAASVEISLATGDPGAAERACREMEEIANTYGTSGLKAGAAHARGAVLLAAGPAEDALATLRTAGRWWRELDAPYEAARVCVLLAQAYASIGDADAVARELEAATAVFDRLGASIDARKVAEARGGNVLPNGLTPRQVEVLALVAAGKSNREIASELVISEKTVARHLENIFARLGLSSRTAAAAYAVEHRLVRGSRG